MATIWDEYTAVRIPIGTMFFMLGGYGENDLFRIDVLLGPSIAIGIPCWNP